MDREPPGGGTPERVVGQDPQEPQGFYPVDRPVIFLPGDRLTVTCEYNSMERDTPTHAGSTSKVRDRLPRRRDHRGALGDR